jgi:hypothetical protein
MSAADQACFTTAVREEAGGDTSKVSTSYCTADRSRRRVVQYPTSQYREQWVHPKHASLQWDSKIVQTLHDKNVSQERLAVVIGDARSLKLLGVPSYPVTSSEAPGATIANLTFDLLSSWHCDCTIVNVTSDTTTSNTGHVSAACISIQQKLNKPLLWSGCRHHLGEVLLSHVFDDF